MKEIKLLFLVSILMFFTEYSMSQNLVSGITGQSTYYEMANDMQSIDPRLSVFNSGGSLENMAKLMNDSSEIDLAFVQYDVLLNYQIRNPETKNKVEIVLPMYKEEVHLVTKIGSNINSIGDIQNKKIAIGSTSQGTNVTSKNIISILNLKCELINIAYRDAFAALLDDRIDAFFYVAGAPVKNLLTFPVEISNLIKLVPIENDKLNGIYKKTTIKKGTYPWLLSDVNTVSVQSFVVFNKTKETNNFNVEKFVKLIADNLQELQTGKDFHQKWNELQPGKTKFPDWPVNETTNKIFNLKK